MTGVAGIQLFFASRVSRLTRVQHEGKLRVMAINSLSFNGVEAIDSHRNSPSRCLEGSIYIRLGYLFQHDVANLRPSE